MAKIDRQKYASMYGPTVGDKIRLADSELFAQIERDFTIYGEENKFGGGKTLRDGMAQSATHLREEGVLDMSTYYYEANPASVLLDNINAARQTWNYG